MENFPYLPFVPSRKTVLRRMGSGKAQFPEALSKDIDRYLRRAQAMFHPAGKAAVFVLRQMGEGVLQIGSETVQSALMAKMLTGSHKAYLMCASIPGAEVNKINEAFSTNEGLLALVLDAYASECVDGALGEMMRIKNAALVRDGHRLTKKRFSAGYGDLDISAQKVFYDMLEMGSLGVSINEKYLLVPEKSVIAVAGVE